MHHQLYLILYFWMDTCLYIIRRKDNVWTLRFRGDWKYISTKDIMRVFNSTPGAIYYSIGLKCKIGKEESMWGISSSLRNSCTFEWVLHMSRWNIARREERTENVDIFLIIPFNHLDIFTKFKSDNNLLKYLSLCYFRMNAYIFIPRIYIVEKPHYLQYAKCYYIVIVAKKQQQSSGHKYRIRLLRPCLFSTKCHEPIIIEWN